MRLPAIDRPRGRIWCEYSPVLFRRRREGSQEFPQYELAPVRDKLAGLAFKIAGGFDVKLDYSLESIKKVEKILGKLHDEYARTGSDEGMNGVALEFAAYIVKVIERNFEPGEWRRDHPELGPDTFPYHWRDGDMFPFAWCQKRIFDGPGDDIWAKFNIIVLDPD